MAQYVYTMRKVGKIVPPKRVILKDISLSFFPGAKIGVLGLNGSGKSSLLRIMGGVDSDFEGEAIPMPNMRVGFLPQEPHLDPKKDVRGNVGEGVGATMDLLKRFNELTLPQRQWTPRAPFRPGGRFTPPPRHGRRRSRSFLPGRARSTRGWGGGLARRGGPAGDGAPGDLPRGRAGVRPGAATAAASSG